MSRPSTSICFLRGASVNQNQAPPGAVTDIATRSIDNSGTSACASCCSGRGAPLVVPVGKGLGTGVLVHAMQVGIQQHVLRVEAFDRILAGEAPARRQVGPFVI